MITKCTYVLLLVFCQFLVHILCQEQCVTPDKKNGECIPIRKCKPLMQHFHKGNISDEVKQFLRNSLCRFTESTPLVCCEKPKIKIENDLLPNRRSCIYDIPDRLLGGSFAQTDHFPWSAILQYRTASGDTIFACGGSIINQRYILTAAHCVTASTTSSVGHLVSVRLGENNISEEEECEDHGVYIDCVDPVVNVTVENVVYHPGYSDNNPNREHDIALVRLAENITYSEYRRPICLPDEDHLPTADTFRLSGWGITAAGRQSDTKRRLDTTLVPQETCRKLFEKHGVNITDGHICTEDPSRREDSCHVDSGGGMFTPSFTTFGGFGLHIEGINSIRAHCVNKELPQVFTKVRKYMDWIKENVKA